MNNQDLSIISIEDVGFTKETLNALKKNNLLTMGALTFMSPEDLLLVYGLTQDSVNEIESKLNKYNSRLRTAAENIMDNFYEDCLFGCEGQLWDNPKPNNNNSAKITHEDIVQLYKERYVNDKNIKKYETIDEDKIRKAVSNIDEQYLDLVYSIIKTNAIRFATDRIQHCDYRTDDKNGDCGATVYATLDGDSFTLFHELGHAASFCKCFDSNEGYYDLLKVATFSDKTLDEILMQELSTNKASVKQKVLDAHRQRVAPVFGEDKYQSIASNVDFMKEYFKLSRAVGGIGGLLIPSSKRESSPKYRENVAKFKDMQKKVIDESLIANLNALENCQAHVDFKQDNIAVLDVLSSVYDMDTPFKLQIHTQNYYKKDPAYLTSELWANLFAFKITGKEDLLFEFSRYLPNTYFAFKFAFEKVEEFYQLITSVKQ